MLSHLTLITHSDDGRHCELLHFFGGGVVVVVVGSVVVVGGGGGIVVNFGVHSRMI